MTGNFKAYAEEENLSISDFKELKTLGVGGFGKVVLVQHQSKFFARKQILKENSCQIYNNSQFYYKCDICNNFEKAKTGEAEVELEKRIMKMSKCPFIVELVFAIR